MKHILFLIFLIFSVTSVFSQKNFIKSFFRGDDGIQYFIKPIVYQTVNKDKLTVDFTLNVINDSVVKIVSNFSSQNSKIKKLLIGSSSFTPKKLFDDYETKKIYSRYTFVLKFDDFKKIFSKEEPIIIDNSKFFLKKSFKKKTAFIKENFIPKLYN
tara:strand:- start:24 stop:491 length:468 start_codon:yes stop_codon:yes gene_type:complete